MKIAFLGTNGWYDTKTGNTSCILIEAGDCHIILDAGNGFYKLDQYIKDDRPIYLFLSHFHLDHIIGLHCKNKLEFRQGIVIYAQKGAKKTLGQIINRPFTLGFGDKMMPYKAKIYELAGARSKPDFLENFMFLDHWSPCLGFRFNFEGKIVSYCTDTAPCANLIKLSKNADLLITECSFRVGESWGEKPVHLNPKTAAKVAKQANVKKLALTHFDASRYKTLQEREAAQIQAQKIFKNTICAIDGMEIEI